MRHNVGVEKAISSPLKPRPLELLDPEGCIPHDLVTTVQKIQDILWVDAHPETGQRQFNPDKKWREEMLEEIRDALDLHGLAGL